MGTMRRFKEEGLIDAPPLEWPDTIGLFINIKMEGLKREVNEIFDDHIENVLMIRHSIYSVYAVEALNVALFG